jgi:hypothetical protein
MTHQRIIVAWLIVELRKRGHNASTAATVHRQTNNRPQFSNSFPKEEQRCLSQ